MRAHAVRDLLRLPVVTELGANLGRVSDVELEVDSAIIVAYIVSPSFVKGLLSADPRYVIRPSQVVSISVDKMVVQDEVVRAEAQQAAATAGQLKNPKAVPLARKAS